jgi:hypothetical protein
MLDRLCGEKRLPVVYSLSGVFSTLNLDLSLGLPNHMAVMDEIESPVEVHLMKN